MLNIEFALHFISSTFKEIYNNAPTSTNKLNLHKKVNTSNNIMLNLKLVDYFFQVSFVNILLKKEF